MAAPDKTPVRPNGAKPPSPKSFFTLSTREGTNQHQELHTQTFLVNKHSLQRLGGAVGVVYEVNVIFLFEVPVGRVPLHKAGDDDEPQDHQIDTREDFIHQRGLAHTES